MIFGVLFLVRYGLNYLIENEKIQNKNNTIFDRRSGLVHLPPVDGEERVYPFDEFAPYQYRTQSPNGPIYYHLMLAHQYSDAYVVSPQGHMEPWEVYLDWEFHQQFMDISKPLPDVPRLEPDRAYDLTSIAWDRRMNRPANYWRDSPEGYFAEASMASYQAAKAFPWGSTRSQAMAAGWQPSFIGHRTWWNAVPSRDVEADTGQT